MNKNTSFRIRSRIYYGDYVYGFIVSLILANILLLAFFITQGSFEITLYIKHMIALSLLGTVIASVIPI